ncbi:hypothetical protein Hanom_Chr00s005447g01729141 [Helianthus anomalus]
MAVFPTLTPLNLAPVDDVNFDNLESRVGVRAQDKNVIESCTKSFGGWGVYNEGCEDEGDEGAEAGVCDGAEEV